MKCYCENRVLKWIVFGVLAISAYFINVEAQSYFGRRAIENTHLVSIPFDEALARAGGEGKIVLVDVSAVWRPNCRRLDNDVFSNSDVRQTINEKFIFSRIEGRNVSQSLRNIWIPKPMADSRRWNYR